MLLLNSNRYLLSESGFTLIELMVTITIIGILAAIATVSFQVNIRRTDLVIVYQELNHFRLPYEILIDEGESVVDFTVSGLNMPTDSDYCQFSVTAPTTNGIAQNAITCQIKKLSYLSNQSLILDRAADGTWQCRASTGILKAYLPPACK